MEPITAGATVVIDQGTQSFQVVQVVAGKVYLQLPDGSVAVVPRSRCELVSRPSTNPNPRPMYWKSGWD